MEKLPNPGTNQPDPGLSELGKEQAFECFNTLHGNEDLNQFNLVSSPLKRAQETSLHFQKKLQISNFP
jgi:broad specificity phosphatase PhoE